jgi:hypothetical protein
VIDFLIVWLPLPPWNDLIGGITVALSIPVIAFPFFGLLTVYYLMASILIINGAAYIIAGITGTVYVPIGFSLARGGSRSFWGIGYDPSIKLLAIQIQESDQIFLPHV